MLPETMFVLERMRRARLSEDASAPDDQLSNWPSTRLEKAILWCLQRMSVWEGFRWGKSGDGEDGSG